jgi:VWFA-related protein
MTRLLIVLAALPLIAQDADTVFRTGTRLVQVDVVVKAKDKNVQGLMKDDFELSDNGKVQPIAVFSERHVTPPAAVSTKLTAGVVTNRPIQTIGDPVSATVLLIDSQNTPPEDQGYSRLQALKYLERATRREFIAVYQLDTTLRLLQSFTDDRDTLHKAVDKFRMTQSLNMVDTGARGNAAAAIEQISQQRRADITTAAFHALARHLKDIPGRKKLVWITTALPLTLTQFTTRNDVQMMDFYDMSKQILSPIQLLNDANVALYPIDPRGPFVSLLDPNLTTMIRLADGTGGKAVYGSNDVAGEIETAISDTDVTYTLGFYPQDEKYDGAEHKLHVRLKDGRGDLRYRTSYTAEAPPPRLTKASREATVNAWMQEPVEATAIPLAAYATPVPNRPGYVEVRLTIDPGSLKFEHTNGRFNGSIQLAIAPDVGIKAKGLRQTIALKLTDANYAKALEGGMVFIQQVLANPAKKDGSMPKQMHVVVMDETTGKAGSVRVPITKP